MVTPAKTALARPGAARVVRSGLAGLGLVAMLIALNACSLMFPVAEPQHRSMQLEDGFEQREYGAYVVAEVTTQGEQKEALRSGFRILFKYIGGANSAGRELSMTAPVTQTLQSRIAADGSPAPASPGEKLAMTAPVTQQGQGRTWRVGFVMPAGRTLEDLPTPTDRRVTLRAVAQRTVLVHQFSGSSDPEDLGLRAQALFATAVRHGLQTVGEPVFAFYDDPTVPWFLRRNEVMVERL